jgi:hypothetical protein
LGRAEVPNFTSEVDAALHTNFDWSGKAKGVITLTLIPENDRVANGVFNTSGDTELEEFNTTCDQIWPEDVSRISDFGLQLPVLLQAVEAPSANTQCFYSPTPPLSSPTQQKASPQASPGSRSATATSLPNRPSHSPQYAI